MLTGGQAVRTYQPNPCRYGRGLASPPTRTSSTRCCLLTGPIRCRDPCSKAPAHQGGMASQNRHPAGSPRSVGGQFADSVRSESDLDLGSSVATFDPELIQRVFVKTGEIARHADQKIGMSRQTADWDADDAQQEALLQWWQDQGRREITDHVGYARTSAYFVTTKIGDKMRAEDRRATRMLAAWKARYEQEHGKHPSQRELDAQAADIVSRWPDRRHLPSRDFHYRSMGGQEVGWQAWVTDEGDDLLANLASRGSSSSVHALSRPGNLVEVDESLDPLSVEEGSWQAAALSLATGTGREEKVRQVQARRICCAALAEARQAPIPQVGSLTHAAVSKANLKLQRYPGGIRGAIATWRTGEFDGGTEAMFAPFGKDLDEGDRDDICNLLELGEPKTLWNSAAWVADANNTDTVKRIVARAA